MKLQTIPYNKYEDQLPQKGKHILGQFENDSIIVYQAFNPKIASYAVEHQEFGGPHYSFNRMSWIKPNFLWMMYRCGWALKEHQQQVLAIEISINNFKKILAEAVHSTFKEHLYGSRKQWQQALKESEVRLQWDPDHHPSGEKLHRKAIQLGLKGNFLKQFGTEWVLSIKDVTPFVKEQELAIYHNCYDDLFVMKEGALDIPEPDLIKQLELS